MDTLLNVPSKDGNYPLMQAVTNDDLECAVRLLQAGARITVPVNQFENRTVALTSMLHEIIYSLTYLEDGGGDAEDRLMLATQLEDLFENPESKYSWVEQVSILLFRTIIGEGVTGTQMRTPLELAKFLGLQHYSLHSFRAGCALDRFMSPTPAESIFLLSFCAMRCSLPLPNPLMHFRWLRTPKYATMLIV